MLSWRLFSLWKTVDIHVRHYSHTVRSCLCWSVKYSSILWHGCQVAHSTLCAYIKFSQSLAQEWPDPDCWEKWLSWVSAMNIYTATAGLTGTTICLLALTLRAVWRFLGDELNSTFRAVFDPEGVCAQWRRQGKECWHLKESWSENGVRGSDAWTPGGRSWAGTLPRIQWGELFGILERKRCS